MTARSADSEPAPGATVRIVAIQCMKCKDGYGGTDLQGAKRWLDDHFHEEPADG